MELTDLLSTPVLSLLLALAATFLGLAAAVQIVQEFYKHLSQSEARTYRQVLVDFAGPWIEQLFQSGAVNDLVPLRARKHGRRFDLCGLDAAKSRRRRRDYLGVGQLFRSPCSIA